MSELALGLMSGTSADGVSAVLVSFKEGGEKFNVLDYRTLPYPHRISKAIANGLTLKTPEISALNFELGDIFAKAALAVLKSKKVSPSRVAVIGSHGQTIFHAPEGNPPSTFQIGEPAVIAERTGISVVSDFRPQDIAAGGGGAPLMPFFDSYFFGRGPVRCLQNVGGMGNVTVVGTGTKPLAFDTGPENRLIDWAARAASGGSKSFDKAGALAKKGRIDFAALSRMAAHPYFKKAPPKSTGKELFNEHFVPATLRQRITKAPQDVLATLTYFTAFTIAEAYRRFIFPKNKVKEVVVSGGGAFNVTLLDYLKDILFPLPVYSIEKLGIHPQAKEPLAFAFFALRALHGKVNHMPEGTGAKRALVLGKITPGLNSLSLNGRGQG